MGSPCPDPSELDALVAGRLEAVLRPGLESHLDGCPACASIVAAMLRLFAPPSGELPYAITAIGTSPPRAGGAEPGPPAVLGRYRLGARLGAGGMGVVYAAHDPELDRPVAIKLLHPERSGDLEIHRARMLREAQAMAKLSHPNVVAVFDVGRVGDQLFLAMELVEGTTLTRWIAERPHARGEIVRMFTQAGQGLAAAHAMGLVHRDFKPDNVLVGSDRRPRVTDFGLARPLVIDEHADLAALPLAATATATGLLVGTPAYMAPEQLRGETATDRSDQFAFCIALYEGLFGERPFAGATVHAIAENVLTGQMRPVPARTPRWLRALLLRGLALDPAARFASMATLLDELGRDHGRARRIALALGSMAVGAGVLVAGLQFAVKAMSPAPAPVTAAVDVAPRASGSGAGAAPPAPPMPPAVVAPPASAPASQPASQPVAPPEGRASAAPRGPGSPSADAPRAPTSRNSGRRFPHDLAVGAIDAFCTIPYDAAHPDPTLGRMIIDWGKITRIEHLTGTFGNGDVQVEVFDIAGQRANYRVENNFGALGQPDGIVLDHARVGDLLAVCPEQEHDLYHLASGPLVTVQWVVPLSAPPRLAEIAAFAPRHMSAARVRADAESGQLDTGRFLVRARIGRADGDQFAVGDWWIDVAPGAPGAHAIATGKQVWLVIGEPRQEPQDGGKPRVVLRVFAAVAELFP